MRLVSQELEIVGRQQHPNLTLPFLKVDSIFHFFLLQSFKMICFLGLRNITTFVGTSGRLLVRL